MNFLTDFLELDPNARLDALHSSPLTNKRWLFIKSRFSFAQDFSKWIIAQAAQCPVRCKRKDIFFNLEWDCNAQRVHVPGFFKTNDLFGHFPKSRLFSMWRTGWSSLHFCSILLDWLRAAGPWMMAGNKCSERNQQILVWPLSRFVGNYFHIFMDWVAFEVFLELSLVSSNF